MLRSEIEHLIDGYISWLKEKTVSKEVEGDWNQITTPFLDRNNDMLQLYVRKMGNSFLLSDGGYTITDLIQSGCSLETKKRQEILKQSIAGFGVSLEEDVLSIQSNAVNFGLKKHNLIQAMLAVNDLFHLASPFVRSLFIEDVQSWLEQNKIRFIANVKFTGKSGYDHLFNFVIPRSQSAPERYIRAITNPTADQAKNIAFSWVDTRENRADNSKAFAILNDSDKMVPPNVIEALYNYDVMPIKWKEREDYIHELAA